MDDYEIDQCKEVFGNFLTGVVVITALSPVGPVGFTCQTFGSLSLEPPSVFFSASTESKSWTRIREVGVMGINILADDQVSLARVFATSGIDKFAGTEWFSAPSGAPFIEGSLANLEGTLSHVTNYGDHDIAVARISAASIHPGAPLAYFRGAYRELA